LSYRKGVNAENQLIRLLKDRAYNTVHSSGSRGSVDVIASKMGLFGLSGRRFAIQVKATTGQILRVPKTELERLREAANQHHCVAVLAVRFSRERWRFWSDEEELLMVFGDTPLSELEGGGGASVELSIDGKTGKLFEQVF
jgi:Holliday junction resolvase